MDDVSTSQNVSLEDILNSRCAYCGGAAEGNYSIHRDGFGLGPEVPLCDEHGAHPEPTEETIWAKIGECNE